MSLCLYTYSNYLTPHLDEDEAVYPLSMIQVFEPVCKSDAEEFLSTIRGKNWLSAECWLVLLG
ncbi:hypothetical protein E2C01_101970 [Portunus trituberculatus]|uniref:Uncharacterized protein n=1 Tax=Portunus trituberculatus TaxID=210409 RepID=A0A5B7KHC0_PORTR|nr:hypothetical protein [Portunus trituberculatus]